MASMSIFGAPTFARNGTSKNANRACLVGQPSSYSMVKMKALPHQDKVACIEDKSIKKPDPL